MNDIDVILADRPGLGRVRLCGCKSVHLTIGPITMNLDPQAFSQAALLVREAMEQLAEMAGKQNESLNALDSIDPLAARISRFTH